MEEHTKSRYWLSASVFAGLVTTVLLMIVGWVLADAANVAVAPSARLARAGRLLGLIVSDPLRVIHTFEIWLRGSMARTGLPPLPWMVAAAGGIAVLFQGAAANPFSYTNVLHGGARPATLADLKTWCAPNKGDETFGRRLRFWLRTGLFGLFLRSRPALSLLDKRGIVLGRMGAGWFSKGVLLRRDATLTALVLAAPGAGKTSGVAMPTLLADGNEAWSMFVYDIKGELYEDTSGWRAKFGPVFRFEPKGRSGARWNPLSPTRSLPGGEAYRKVVADFDALLSDLYGAGDAAVEARTRLLKMQRGDADWRVTLAANPRILGAPIASESVVRARLDELIEFTVQLSVFQADRETYLWRLASDLIPEPPGGGGGNAKHFADTGRTALMGWMGYTVARCERDGVEPNFGRLLDFWSDGLIQFGGNPEADGEDDNKDAITSVLQSWIDECGAYGYPERYRKDLADTKSKPPNERGSVVSTAINSLSIFKIATVRDRTSTSDFSLDEIRGMKGADGKDYPVTVYVVVSLEDIKSMAPILMMFTQALQNRLISQPAKVAKKSRPVLFILDEFAQIPKMDCLLSGPAVGRGQRVANLLIAQSYGQIEATYGKSGVTILNDTSEWKVVFPLTDPTSAQSISNMIGKRTVRQGSISHQQGISLNLFSSQPGRSPFERNVNESYQGIPLFEPSDLMSTSDGGKFKPGQQQVLQYTRYNRPIPADTPFYFRDRAMVKRSRIAAPSSDDATGFGGPLKGVAPVVAAPPRPEAPEAPDGEGDGLRRWAAE